MAPIEIGLLSTQQDSFEHHEELSKLLNESDVFYVPLRSEFHERKLSSDEERFDLTKSFDEDLSRRHLVVTFRDIGYSLFLDSVESLRDEIDQSKIRVSGKMVVDGICVQFLGRFDCNHNIERKPDGGTQQIIGVGRVVLDDNYYRQLSSIQVNSSSDGKNEDENISQPIIASRKQSSSSKMKGQAISRSSPLKIRTSIEQSSSRSSMTNVTSPVSPSSLPSRFNLHQQSHKPYSSSTRRTNKLPTSFDKNAEASIENTSNRTSFSFPSNPSPHLLSNRLSGEMSSSSTTNTVQATTIPQYGGVIQLATPHPFSNYALPSATLSYSPTPLLSATNNELPALGGTLFIFNSAQAPHHPFHIVTPPGYPPISVAYQPTPSVFFQPSLATIQNCNSFLNVTPPSVIKRSETNANTSDTVKQSEEQLPFKKRRYAGQQTQNILPHNDDDDELSDESSRK